MSRPPSPAYVGTERDDNVADGLARIQDTLDQCGVIHVKATEVCRLYHTDIARKLYDISGRGQVYAIPPATLLPNVVAFCQRVFEPLRVKLGEPIFVKNFYRPPQYNRAVRGAAKSRHQWAQGADLYPIGGPSATYGAHDLRNAAIDLFLDREDEPIGIGLYAGNVHLDWGYYRRSWGSRRRELEVARSERAEQPDTDDYLKGGVDKDDAA